MSVAAPKNTLMYQRRGRPLTLKRDLSNAPVTEVGSKIRAFRDEHGGEVKPETEAIQFYLANHAMKELEFRFDMEEPLPDWALHICDEYHRISARIAARAFYYLLLITAREARHNQSKSTMKSKIENQFGKGAAMGLLHYPDENSVEAVTGVFDTYCSGAKLGDICRSIVMTHYEGNFISGYGGKKWGNVADCMTAFVTGDYTAEMMLDTVWTLVHNGGPIFNKSMLYSCYDTSALQMVLDIQRAGQIPRLVRSPYGHKMVWAEKYVNKGAKDFAALVEENMPDAVDFQFGVQVDFDQLKALGAIGSYTHLKEALAAKPKPPEPAFSHPPFGSAGAAKAAVPVATEKTHYIIAQAVGLMFPKLTRAQLED